MPLVNIRDSANQKYDPAGSSLSSVNVQAAIDELDAKPTPPADFSNAEFPDSAHFANEVAAVSAVDFNAGNKQLISGSAGNITLAAPGVGSYMLYVADSGTITGIADSGAGTITWVGPVPTWAAGKLAAIACGRTGAGNWILNGSVEE